MFCPMSKLTSPKSRQASPSWIPSQDWQVPSQLPSNVPSQLSCHYLNHVPDQVLRHVPSQDWHVSKWSPKSSLSQDWQVLSQISSKLQSQCCSESRQSSLTKTLRLLLLSHNVLFTECNAILHSNVFSFRRNYFWNHFFLMALSNIVVVPHDTLLHIDWILLDWFKLSGSWE